MLVYLICATFLMTVLCEVQKDKYLFWNYEDDVHFFLFTRSNPDVYQELKTNDRDTLLRSNFDFNKRSKIVVHGWISNGTSFVADIIKNAYLQKTDDNIISVDWSALADKLYLAARSFVPTVSQLLTEFLKFLVANGVRTSDLHLIGHSLGAHVVGVAGRYYKEIGSPILAITGLDPAYPLFLFSKHRLDKSDALHLEVIHTCEGFLGYPSPLGHIDFYPNGSKKQPGCGFDIRGACAHDRSAQYFAESIVSPVSFIAVQCESYDEVYYNETCQVNGRKKLYMSGLYLNFGEQGVYYLKTNSQSPFALGDPLHWNSTNKQK